MFFSRRREPQTVTDTLAAEINRTGVHSLEVPASFETDGSFVVELRNQGEPTHVHLHLDDSLSAVAQLEANNHYVQGDSQRQVRIEVRGSTASREIAGRLKIVTAYGRETRYVNVSIDTTGPSQVAVDPSLSKPKPETQPGTTGRLLSPDVLPAVVLGLVAVVLAAGALAATDGIDVVLGVLAVLAGVLAAGFVAIR